MSKDEPIQETIQSLKHEQTLAEYFHFFFFDKFSVMVPYSYGKRKVSRSIVL